MGTKIRVGRDTEVVVEDPGQRLSLTISQAGVANAARLEQDDSVQGERLVAESTGGRNRRDALESGYLRNLFGLG